MTERPYSMAAVASFTESQLEALAAILDEPTGREIGELLRRLSIEDPEPTITKRHRLRAALSARQSRDKTGNIVATYIQAAMDPVRYSGRAGIFDGLRARLNEVLAFSAIALGEDGKLRATVAAATLDEAAGREERLRRELLRRGVHADVLRFCRAELLQQNYFHAVFEATKSVGDKLRNLTGLTADGAELVDEALGLGRTGVPLLAFNTLRTEPEQSEHKGLMNLIKGMFGAFRNVTAHAPKISWVITEQDAMDLLTLASLLHRRLDGAVSTRRGPL